MKKNLLTILFIFFLTTLFSQTFNILKYDKADVSNGSFAVDGIINTTIKAQIYIVNTSATAADFRVKKVESSIISGTINTFCFDNQCLPPFVFETSTAMTLQPGDTTLATDFYGEYSPYAHQGTSIITYVIINDNDATDSVYVQVSFNATATSVTEINFSRVEFSNPFPNPATSFVKFNYNIPFAYNNAALTIRNLIGSTVKEATIYESQGRLNIDLGDLQEGIYFYSLLIDNKVVLTRKFIKN